MCGGLHRIIANKLVDPRQLEGWRPNNISLAQRVNTEMPAIKTKLTEPNNIQRNIVIPR